LLWKSKDMRFNEISRALRNKGIVLSKPTLSEHLKRTSKEETEKWLDDLLSKIPGIITENPSPEEHAGYALCNIFIHRLEEVALRLNIEPKIQNQSLSFSNSKARQYEDDLIRECNKDEEYRTVVFSKTKELIRIFSELRTIITS
jgi:hypothetical protein